MQVETTMRSILPLLAAATVAAASAQAVDPRTGAEAAGDIAGHVTPGIDTPAEVDPSRDPALGARAPAQAAPSVSDDALPAEPGARVQAPPPASGAETVTAAPVEKAACRPDEDQKACEKRLKDMPAPPPIPLTP